jgi:hypothetical protein
MSVSHVDFGSCAKFGHSCQWQEQWINSNVAPRLAIVGSPWKCELDLVTHGILHLGWRIMGLDLLYIKCLMTLPNYPC